MKYQNCVSAVFLERPNRFIAKVLLDGREEIVHVKNTGRCKELLLEGAVVYLTRSDREDRKTKYDLIAVKKERRGKKSLLVNMDSQAPNLIAEEWLEGSGFFSPQAIFRRERFFHTSRFDLYVEDGERHAFIEVKGVTLEEEGRASFPDAPTIRGVKHLKELSLAVSEGYEAYVLFVIQMKEIRTFSPNDRTHPAFGEALREAKKKGVRLLAVDCKVLPDAVTADSLVPIIL